MENRVESTDLIAEAQRYLAVVEAFRAEGCELHWRLDSTAPGAPEPGQTAAWASPGAWLERG